MIVSFALPLSGCYFVPFYCAKIYQKRKKTAR